MTEINSINLMHNTFSNIYFFSYVCSKRIKVIHKITFFCTDMFPSGGLPYTQNHLKFR
jgi:hypothetical protein